MSALARFERYLNRRFSHSSTPIHYLSDLRIFIRSHGDEPQGSITAADIDVFVDAQLKAGLCISTVNRRLACLQTFFEFLASENLEDSRPNPVIKRRHALKTGFRLPRDASDEEVARIFAVVSSARDKAMFGLMVGAGLRVGEVAALCLADIEEPSVPDSLVRLTVRGKGNKERIVWLTDSLWNTLKAWLRDRPETESDQVFLNWHGQPITKNGIQYIFKRHSDDAGVTLSCHQLRHTYARRLAESGLPVESLARLLGHTLLQTTQRYIDGANPSLYADFSAIMAKLETTLIRDKEVAPPLPPPTPTPKPRTAPEDKLITLRQRLEIFPPWLAKAVDAYLAWRWSTWREQTAFTLGRTFLGVVWRLWNWLENNRQIDGWDTFKRSDLQAWLNSRLDDGVKHTTARNELARFRSFLTFLDSREYGIDPGLFRVRPPRGSQSPLPRYLSETDYGWLETNILQATREGTYNSCFDRAWFLTLSHTGMRLSELLDLRLGDLNLPKGFIVIRGGKPGRDRIAYLTPSLTKAVSRYLHLRPEIDDDHVFILRGRPPSPRTIQRRLTVYGEQANVEVSPHRLRHTFATRLLNQGMSIHSLQKLLGHQNLNTTQIYARVYDETLYQQFQNAMSRLESKVLEPPLQDIGQVPAPIVAKNEEVAT